MVQVLCLTILKLFEVSLFVPDTKIETSTKVQKQEPSQTSCDPGKRESAES